MQVHYDSNSDLTYLVSITMAANRQVIAIKHLAFSNMGTMYNILQFLKQQKEILITKNKTAFCQ
jgi:uncharacterized protein YuzE